MCLFPRILLPRVVAAIYIRPESCVISHSRHSACAGFPRVLRGWRVWNGIDRTAHSRHIIDVYASTVYSFGPAQSTTCSARYSASRFIDVNGHVPSLYLGPTLHLLTASTSSFPRMHAHPKLA
jgi:hypothetical protein